MLQFFKIVVVFQGNLVRIFFADQEEKEKPVSKFKDGKIRLFGSKLCRFFGFLSLF